MRTVNIKANISVFEESDNMDINGTSKVGELNGLLYSDLVDMLGEPTFDEASGDQKVQKEWVLEFKGDIFTIYDWKTYDEYYTMNELDSWSIGGSTSCFELSEVLQAKYESL